MSVSITSFNSKVADAIDSKKLKDSEVDITASGLDESYGAKIAPTKQEILNHLQNRHRPADAEQPLVALDATG